MKRDRAAKRMWKDPEHIDYGVSYEDGRPLVRCRSGEPEQGQYFFDSKNATYTFADTDTGKVVHFHDRTDFLDL